MCFCREFQIITAKLTFTLAGIPETLANGGTSFVTILLAVITAPSPTFILPKTVQESCNITPLPTRVILKKKRYECEYHYSSKNFQ